MKQKLQLTTTQMILLPGAVLFNFFVYYGGRFLATGREHYDLSCAVDAQIPFLPWTILVYLGCYLFWVFNYYLGVRFDARGGWRFIGAHIIGETIAFIFFVFLPTTVVRPQMTGNSLAELFVRLTYLRDEPNNLFPSLHCFISWLCWIGVRSKEQIPVWYRWLSLVLAISVCVSTLTVKQHVLADVPAGILLAELGYLIAGFYKKDKKKQDYMSVGYGADERAEEALCENLLNIP